MQKPRAQGGARFSAFHAPPCADFLRFLSAIDFGAPLARLVKMTIFFKLQAGVSLVSSAPPPRLQCPAPRLRHTQNRPFKITLLVQKRGHVNNLDSLNLDYFAKVFAKKGKKKQTNEAGTQSGLWAGFLARPGLERSLTKTKKELWQAPTSGLVGHSGGWSAK